MFPPFGCPYCLQLKGEVSTPRCSSRYL